MRHTKTSDAALDLWADHILKEPSSGFSSTSSCDRIGRVVDETDHFYRNNTPKLHSTPWIVRTTQSAIDAMPNKLSKVLVAHWLASGTAKDKAKYIGCNYHSYQDRLRAGLYFLEGWLKSQQQMRLSA